MCQAKARNYFPYILLPISCFLLTFLDPLSLYPSITKHKKEIYTLRSTLKKAITKSKVFKTMFREAETKVKDRLKVLRKTQKEIPIRESTKYGYQFSYYENDIVLYESEKGIGLKIRSEERLFKSKNSVSYTLEGHYKYKRFKSKEGEWIYQILTPEYAFWKKDNMYGFKKTTSDGNIIYKYYAKTKGRKVLRHKVTLSSKANYTIDNEKEDSRYFYHFKDQQLIIVRKGWSITYKYSKTLGYTCWTDGNISLSPALAKIIYNRDTAERQKYVKDILLDWPDTLFSQYLKLLVMNKANLSKPQDVYLTLINYTRKQYGLSPLKVSSTLNKICTLHGKYLLRHKPRNMHLQDRRKKGYFGKTPFQRRKKFKYQYRVSERILFGDNPIRSFIKVRRFRWKYEILDPRAV
ncbi:MAG TPA: CAP domain-containing protein, partial [Spirochaetes bacterium]|nr:CAP domain-containing protein [Spirochaetota bacterium]